MRFQLIDRILEVQPGKRLVAVKNLTLGEEYLADHFPSFPVMPGVMMLQALVEAGSWLLRVTDEFAHSMIVLREVKNIKYGSFMEPGKQLRVEVELAQAEEGLAVLKGKGECEGKSAVTARLTLSRSSLAHRDSALAATDERLIQHWRERYAWLSRGLTTTAADSEGNGS